MHPSIQTIWLHYVKPAKFEGKINLIKSCTHQFLQCNTNLYFPF